MTKIFINNVWSRLGGLTDVKLIDEIDEQLSYFVEGYQYMRAFKQGWFDKNTGEWKQWDGKRHLLSNKMMFPTGFLTRIKELLVRSKIEFDTLDLRTPIVKGESFKLLGPEPWPHQKKAVEAALKNERGIIRVGTGGGKSKIATMLMSEYNINTILYVVGKDLLHQFYKEMCKTIDPNNIGIVGDGYCDVRKFTVCSVWTAATAFDLKTNVSLDDEDWAPEIISAGPKNKRVIQNAIEDAKLVIFDEAHFLACETIQAIFKASKKCHYMFGLTGTDWRDDSADILLEASCGKRIYNMSASKLIEQGYLVTPKIALVEVPPLTEECANSWSSVYSKYITNNEVRNRLIVEGAKKLIEMGRKTLILVRYIPHGQKLVDMLGDLPVFFVNGQIDGQKRQEIKEKFEKGELKCLVGSAIFDIGINLPSLDALVLAGGGKSSVRVLQRIGRVIRAHPGKTDAFVMDFIDNAKYLDKHSAIRIAVYGTEPGFKVKFPKGFDQNSLKKIKKIKVK